MALLNEPPLKQEDIEFLALIAEALTRKLGKFRINITEGVMIGNDFDPSTATARFPADTIALAIKGYRDKGERVECIFLHSDDVGNEQLQIGTLFGLKTFVKRLEQGTAFNLGIAIKKNSSEQGKSA